jgi:hypothetical protein
MNDFLKNVMDWLLSYELSEINRIESRIAVKLNVITIPTPESTTLWSHLDILKVFEKPEIVSEAISNQEQEFIKFCQTTEIYVGSMKLNDTDLEKTIEILKRVYKNVETTKSYNMIDIYIQKWNGFASRDHIKTKNMHNKRWDIFYYFMFCAMYLIYHTRYQQQ